ncbi:MAG: DNA helicase [Pseudomonadota bacterium]
MSSERTRFEPTQKEGLRIPLDRGGSKMRLQAPIYHLKRQAKRLSRDRGIPHHQALDQIAAAEGFQSWSHLAAASTERPAARIMGGLTGGDMVLLAARPGHGKTLLGLELAIAAARAGRPGFVFTLDYTRRDVLARLADLGIPAAEAGLLTIDTSDEICADYIIERLSAAPGAAFALIDYLQLLDQKRANPDLATQIQALKAHVRATGAIVAAISQIDRQFDLRAAELPGLADIRLPNPADLSAFTRACFLHDGEIRCGPIA